MRWPTLSRDDDQPCAHPGVRTGGAGRGSSSTAESSSRPALGNRDDVEVAARGPLRGGRRPECAAWANRPCRAVRAKLGSVDIVCVATAARCPAGLGSCAAQPGEVRRCYEPHPSTATTHRCQFEVRRSAPDPRKVSPMRASRCPPERPDGSLVSVFEAEPLTIAAVSASRDENRSPASGVRRLR